MSESQDDAFWSGLQAMGGQFWPLFASENGEPGADFPLRVSRKTDDGFEWAQVYDLKELEAALKNGWNAKADLEAIRSRNATG